MRRINYKSDIPPLLLSLKVDENQITVPDCDFIVRFYIEGYEGRHYDCSHIGGVWSNCEPSEDGTKLVCYINNQRLGIGELCAEFHYISPDRRYGDGSQKSVVIIDSTELGIELVEDNGDAVTEAAIDVTLPFIYRTAYEIARDHGYIGTAEDFYSALASVVGIADAEKKRVTAEITRNANEQERIENEENRLNAENGRVNAEAQRVRNEAIRGDAESNRVEQEEDRKAKFKEITEFIATVRANEGNRESNELERQTNEDTRITEEAKRVAAEKKRAAEFEQQKIDLSGKIDRSGDEMGGDLIFTGNTGVSFRTSGGGAHTMFNDTDDVAKFMADNGDTFEFKQNETPNKNSSAVVVSANLYNALDMTLDSMGSALDGDAAYRAEAGDKIFNPDTGKIQRYNSTIGGFEDLCDPIDGKLYANKMTDYIYRWNTKANKMAFVGGVKAYTKEESDALLSGKVSKSDIVQSTGTSETAVMSQKAVSDIVDGLVDCKEALVEETIIQSKNLLNTNDPDVLVGRYIVSTGVGSSSQPDWTTSGFVPVTSGDVVRFYYAVNVNSLSSNRTKYSRIISYDENKVVIDGSYQYNTLDTYTCPTNAKYIRIAYQHAYSNFYLEKNGDGTTPTYEPYQESFVTYKIKDLPTKVSELENDSHYVDDNDLVKSVESVEEKMTFKKIEGVNLLNTSEKYEEDVDRGYIIGKRLITSGTNIGNPQSASSSFNTSGYIKVNEGDKFFVSLKLKTQKLRNNYTSTSFIYAFTNDEPNGLVPEKSGLPVNDSIYIVPSGINYLRIAHPQNERISNVMIEKNREFLETEQYVPFIGNNGFESIFANKAFANNLDILNSDGLKVCSKKMNVPFSAEMAESVFQTMLDEYEAVNMDIPTFTANNNQVLIRVKSQQEFDNIQSVINTKITEGALSLLVVLDCETLYYKDKHFNLVSAQYPNSSNVDIVITATKGTTLIAGGNDYSLDNAVEYRNGRYICAHASSYDYKNCFISGGEEVKTRSEIKYALSGCETISTNYYRVKIAKEDWATDATHIMVTARYNALYCLIDKIENGYVYFSVLFIGLEDSSGKRINQLNPDTQGDLAYFGQNPRYKLINSSKMDAFVSNGEISIDASFNSVHECESTTFAEISTFKSVSIIGIHFVGNAEEKIYSGTYSSLHGHELIHIANFVGSFVKVSKNHFEWIKSSICGSHSGSSNVMFDNNTIENCYKSIFRSEYGTTNNYILSNYSKNTSLYMSNWGAYYMVGQNELVKGNTLVNYGLYGISGGSDGHNDMSGARSGIVEDNIVANEEEYVNDSWKYGGTETGAIYHYRESNGLIIRNNVVMNTIGFHDNSAIFIDGFCPNVAVYGNFVLGTRKGADITMTGTNAAPYVSNRFIMNNILSSYISISGNNDRCNKGRNFRISQNLLETRDDFLYKFEEEDDVVFNNCEVKDNCICIPSEYKQIIASLPISDKLKCRISFKSC